MLQSIAPLRIRLRRILIVSSNNIDNFGRLDLFFWSENVRNWNPVCHSKFISAVRILFSSCIVQHSHPYMKISIDILHIFILVFFVNFFLLHVLLIFFITMHTWTVRSCLLQLLLAKDTGEKGLNSGGNEFQRWGEDWAVCRNSWKPDVFLGKLKKQLGADLKFITEGIQSKWNVQVSNVYESSVPYIQRQQLQSGLEPEKITRVILEK